MENAVNTRILISVSNDSLGQWNHKNTLGINDITKAPEWRKTIPAQKSCYTNTHTQREKEITAQSTI